MVTVLEIKWTLPFRCFRGRSAAHPANAQLSARVHQAAEACGGVIRKGRFANNSMRNRQSQAKRLDLGLSSIDMDFINDGIAFHRSTNLCLYEKKHNKN